MTALAWLETETGDLMVLTKLRSRRKYLQLNCLISSKKPNVANKNYSKCRCLTYIQFLPIPILAFARINQDGKIYGTFIRLLDKFSFQ